MCARPSTGLVGCDSQTFPFTLLASLFWCLNFGCILNVTCALCPLHLPTSVSCYHFKLQSGISGSNGARGRVRPTWPPVNLNALTCVCVWRHICDGRNEPHRINWKISTGSNACISGTRKSTECRSLSFTVVIRSIISVIQSKQFGEQKWPKTNKRRMSPNEKKNVKRRRQETKPVNHSYTDGALAASYQIVIFAVASSIWWRAATHHFTADVLRYFSVRCASL